MAMPIHTIQPPGHQQSLPQGHQSQGHQPNHQMNHKIGHQPGIQQSSHQFGPALNKDKYFFSLK